MTKLTTIKLARVQYIPKSPEPGILYVSEEFGAAVHLCACGCGAKVSTPLGPTEWSLTVTASGPSLYPSVGNWQFLCKSHYWIFGGEILWAEEWTPEQIEAGREAEDLRRRRYYVERDRQRIGILRRFWHWLISFFR
jgi:Family of unknown function (DUF6527)